jgi:hypothetical protein
MGPLDRSAEAVRLQLERILCSSGFAHAERRSRFLRFTVESALAGGGDQIKEYLVGVEVFDREASYNPQIDPIVRVEAGRVRSKLKEYYEKEGRQDPLVIEFPKGSYVPLFEVRDATSRAEPLAEISQEGEAGAFDGACREHDHWAAVAVPATSSRSRASWASDRTWSSRRRRGSVVGNDRITPSSTSRSWSSAITSSSRSTSSARTSR